MRDRENSSALKKEPGGNEKNTVAAMRLFYNLFPYPNRPLFFFPEVRAAVTSHLGFQRLLSERNFFLARKLWNQSKQRKIASDEDFLTLNNKLNRSDRICLAGCGTDEPLLFQMLHPAQSILGIDLSDRSIAKAKRRIAMHRLFNGRDGITTLIADNFCDVSREKLGDNFHMTQCFGVLHHQKNPWPFVEKLLSITAPGGFLRIMIYSANGRRLERRVQSSQSAVWEKDISKLAVHLSHLKLWIWQIANQAGLWGRSARNRFRYLGTSKSTVADAFLHPSDHVLDPDELVRHITAQGFRLIFCEAKIWKKGWVAGIENAQHAWAEIIEAERQCNLTSNVVITFERLERPSEQPQEDSGAISRQFEGTSTSNPR